MTRQNFDTVDVLRLEVETDPTGLTNLVQNPNGELGGWGWVTPVSGSAMAGLDGDLEYTSPGSVASYFYSENISITAGEYAAASWYADGGATGYYHRVKFEWLNSSGTLLSSSTQTGYLSVTSFSTNYYGPYQAPASTAYLRIRFDIYSNNSGANPAAGSQVYFNAITVAKAATSGALGTLRTNLCMNPSFETNASLWTCDSAALTRVTSPAGAVGSACMQVNPNVNSKFNLWIHGTSAMAVPLVVGSQHAISASVRAATTSRAISMGLAYFDSSLNYLGSSAATVGSDSVGSWTRYSRVTTATNASRPSAAYVAPVILIAPSALGELHYIDAVLWEQTSTVGSYFDGSTSAGGGWTYGWSGTANNSTSTATSSNLAYIEPVEYLNILDSLTSINVVREELNVGTLSASLRSAALDPSSNDLLRPGRRCRLMALDDNTDTYTPLFTGKLLRAHVDYDPLDLTDKRARVELTAVDNVSVLSQQARSTGVASIDDLPYVLEGCGVPWNVNGSGDQVASATQASYNENASALDQVAITRDSNHGYTWVDRFGVLQAWDNDAGFAASDRHGPSTGGPVLIETDITDLDLSFDTGDLINEVVVRYQRFNATTLETTEVVYGPYRDETSISEWGVSRAEFAVQGISEGSVSTFASEVLTANATPEIRLNSVSTAITETSTLTTASGSYAFTDLYEYCYVDPSYVAPDLGDFFGRVTRVEHSITPEKWLLHIGFSKLDAVAAPQLTPSPGNASQTDGTWITPTLGSGWVNAGGADAPARFMRKDGVVYIEGTIKSGTLGGTAFTLPAGYRPSATLPLATIANGAFARIAISSSGVVSPVSGSNVWFSLSGISFPAEQ